ncbi:MAG: hypothetical protein H6953_02990 [Chromatiaceae bacterium]|nr:hypothetical protein [Chromatiaceae bacterium]MCP5314117.1 hypothetical protein [Chromatiaceae bacterium]
MCPVVRIPDNVYSRLEKHAVGFDTPASVIERILDHYEGVSEHDASPEEKDSSDVVPTVGKRDTTKYRFRGKKLGKGRLVLAVIKEYVADHAGTSCHDLQVQFPKHLQGSNGVFNKEAEAREIVERTSHKRHFLKSNELIHLADCKVAVSTEWGKGNIDNFIRQARSLGYEIEEVRG